MEGTVQGNKCPVALQASPCHRARTGLSQIAWKNIKIEERAEALGGGLGTILFPKVFQGRPNAKKLRKMSKLWLPPQGASWETKFGTFTDSWGLFSYYLFESYFGSPPGRLFIGFRRFPVTFLNIFLLFVDVKRKLWNVTWHIIFMPVYCSNRNLSVPHQLS